MITLLSSTQINNPHFSKDGNMRDYCDSPSFKEHALFRDDLNALQIQLYYDDLEVVNPLGGNTKVHKLGRQYGTKQHVCTPTYTQFICTYTVSCHLITWQDTHRRMSSLVPNRPVLLHTWESSPKV